MFCLLLSTVVHKFTSLALLKLHVHTCTTGKCNIWRKRETWLVNSFHSNGIDVSAVLSTTCVYCILYIVHHYPTKLDQNSEEVHPQSLCCSMQANAVKWKWWLDMMNFILCLAILQNLNRIPLGYMRSVDYKISVTDPQISPFKLL